jgi:predicted transcriptional regulator
MGMEKTAWHLAAENSSIEVLEKILEWAKEAQVNTNELKNKLILTKSGAGISAWHLAAEKSSANALGKLWGWAKEAQLNSGELQNKLLFGQYWNGRTA